MDMCQAIEEMKRDSMEEGIQQGMEEGMQQGMKEGMQQGARKTALNLQKIGMPVEQIAHMVGYSSEQVSQWLLRDRKKN